MFIEKVQVKSNAQFQKDHVYIFRGIVNAKRYSHAGTLDGREGGIVMRLVDIEEDGTHVFHEMVYARNKCQIALEGYICVYTIESKDLNVSDFEDITDDTDFTELLHSIKENEKIATPWIKRVAVKDTLVEKAIEIITLLFLSAVLLTVIAGIVYFGKKIEISDFFILCSILPVMSFGTYPIYRVSAALFDSYMLPDQMFFVYDIQEMVNKKDNTVLETIYKKNDVLLQTFEQKKHLERS
jgi:hypothetical protein